MAPQTGFEHRQLVLESHCRSRPAPPPFAKEWGFSQIEWFSPPVLGVPSPARVGPPFFADIGETFLTRHTPACVIANGWEPESAEHLSQVCLVRCQLASIGDETQAWGRAARLVELLPTEILDPIQVSGAALPTDLEGTLIDPRPREKFVLVGSDRVLVDTTMEGDVNFEFWLRKDRPEIFLLADTSICQGYVYSGNGLLSPALYERLTGRETLASR